MSNGFQQKLCESARAPLTEWLTDVADIKMQVDIRSLINNFIKDFYSFESKPYVIVLTCVLQVFPHSGVFRLSVQIVKINTPKVDKILKVESNFSVLKFMYLSQIASDLSKPGLKI